MATNVIIVDGLTGGTNTNVIKVITQTTENSDAVINATANKGHILTSATLQTINLPDTSLVGDIFYFQGKGIGLFRVAQKAGQQIIFGDAPTTVGVTGYIESTDAGDGVFLICSEAPGIFTVMPAPSGTFDIDGTATNNAINNTASGGLAKITTSDASVNLSPNTFYELDSGTLQTLSLPATDNDGDVIGIGGVGSGLFKVVQSLPTHQILYGTTPTTLGTSGTFESTEINSVIYLTRLLAAGRYLASTSQGNFLIDGTTLNNAINDSVLPFIVSETGFFKTNNHTGWVSRGFSFTTSFVEFLPSGATYATKLSADFTNPSTGRLKYIGTETKPFIIKAKYNTGSVTTNFAIAVAINDITETDSETYALLAGNVDLAYAVTLSTNDEVSILSKANLAAFRTVYSYSLSIIG